MRKEITQEIRETLMRSGFKVSDEHNLRSVCFDLVARRDALLLFLKIVSNVDTFSDENAEELKLLSKILDGTPMLVGLHSGAGPLEDEVVYSRFDIPLLTPPTLFQYLVEEVPPIIFAAPGGYCVHLDGALLRELREERDISLGELASIAGVSRRSIQLYEEGQRGTLVDVAMRIEEFLDFPLIRAVSPLRSDYDIDTDKHRDMLSSMERFYREAFAHLMASGCHIVSTARSPFETLLEERVDILLTGMGRYDRTLIKKAKVIGNVSEIVEKRSLIVVDKRLRKSDIDGTPLVGVKEILCQDSMEELLELVRERSKE